MVGRQKEGTVSAEDEFDIVVIGGGPGGYATALYGAAAGLSVAVVERDKVGGTCLHRGCVPAKEFLETASVHRTVAGAGEFGISVANSSLDFSVSQDRKNGVVDKLFKGLAGLMKGRKVTVLSGSGTLEADRHVRVVDGDDAGRVVVGRNVVLAAGSVPRTLPGLEVDGKWVLTSDEFLDLKELPASAAVIGGGAIGCEFASLLSDLGTKVTVLEALDSILTGCDDDMTRVVARSFKKRGIDVLTGVQVDGHTPGRRGRRHRGAGRGAVGRGRAHRRLGRSSGPNRGPGRRRRGGRGRREGLRGGGRVPAHGRSRRLGRG